MNKIVTNSIDFYPLKLSELKFILEENGFSKIKTYSDFNKTEFTSNSFRLIITANK